MLPEIGRKSRTCATRATDVIFERKHCSRRRSHTQVEITSLHKQLEGQSHVIAGTVPESLNARTQGRPMAGLRFRLGTAEQENRNTVDNN